MISLSTSQKTTNKISFAEIEETLLPRPRVPYLVLVLGPAPLVDVLLDPRARRGGGVFVVHRGLVDLVLVAQLVIGAPLFVDVAAAGEGERRGEVRQG